MQDPQDKFPDENEDDAGAPANPQGIFPRPHDIPEHDPAEVPDFSGLESHDDGDVTIFADGEFDPAAALVDPDATTLGDHTLPDSPARPDNPGDATTADALETTAEFTVPDYVAIAGDSIDSDANKGTPPSDSSTNLQSKTTEQPPEESGSPVDPEGVATGPAAMNGQSNRVSRTAFLILASYASAVTIALIYVLTIGLPGAHRLESLPDLPPLEEHEFQIIPVQEAVAPGHELKLGAAAGRRFGNVIVTPLKVTRGPVEFEYFQEDARIKPRAATAPVLKLWLEFENVSKNQSFPPLDLRLMTHEHIRESDFLRLANTFVRPADATDPESLVFVLGHSPDDPWNLKGQALGKAIGPGEKCVIYIPTESENLEVLQGDLVWRVQFRKGFHPETKHGVTTLIDVMFSDSQIEDEA